MAATPPRETHNGIDVLHPRYALPPKVGMNIAPLTLALGARKSVQRLLDEGFDFDVIDAHYYYPDGVAAALLARWFDKPFTVTARGTDLNLIPRYALPRRLMQWTARRANASIGVCRALVDVLISWGIDPGRLHVFRNGVDLERFRPVPQPEARAALGLTGSPLLLSVGYLIERKGQHLLIEALAQLRARLPGAHLVLVGDGPERARLEALAARLGVLEQVNFVGAVSNAALYQWYSAADVFLLASSREGWANVLLEAMACGTPVVATDIWGTPEVVADASVGRLVDRRDAAAFATGIVDLWQSKPDRRVVRSYAEGFSWMQTSDAQLALFSRIVARGPMISHA
jgi:glycosyltransferase involved in cell wall biosynthesis